MPHQLVSELPQCLIDALKSVAYNKRDIEILPQDKTAISFAGGDGRRGFAILVNLSTGEHEIHVGSWGGANAFNSQNQVDLNTQEYPIPENGAVILGSEGNKTFAKILLNPANMLSTISSGNDLSDIERKIMYAYGCLKSGPYRNEELARCGVKDPKNDTTVQSLIDRRFLKLDGRGIQITTEGKNTRKNSAGSGTW